jgi:uncharacterized repeat protein (TIGR02543 family)
MSKKRNFIFICLLILGVFLITSCLPKPPVTEGILKGQVIVPESSKQLTGQALADATVNIIDPATGDIIATTVTDANGYYQVFVPAGGPYLLEAVKDGVKILQITPQVEVGIEYELGTADCGTTAVALIALAMMDAGANLADIDLADIEADPNFDDVVSSVTSIIEAGEDPTDSAVIEQAVEDFLSPPAPPAPAPTPTYTVTFDKNDTGATGTMVAQTIASGSSANLTACAFTKTGWTFAGWAETSGGTVVYVDGASYTMGSANVTLYAQWTGPVHNITQDTYYTAIQVALDAAVTGDIIEVNDGTYTESITFPDGKLITLKSVNGAPFTTITGVHDSATVTCGSSLEDTTLEGFTVTHNSGYTGRGITVTAGYLTIKNCTISNNSVTDNSGGGIYNGSGTLTITGSEISNNFADSNGYHGGGIYNENGTTIITSSTISDNSADDYGGGIYNEYGDFTITSSTISTNTADDSGGGIYHENGTAIITSSTISINSATDSGGGGIYSSDTLTITDSEISGNSAPDGGGIYHWYGDLTITSSTISGNTATNSDGGGIYNGLGTSTITDSIISSNSAADGGGIYIYDSSPTIQNNTISGNTASVSGGGIYIENGLPTIGGADGSDTGNFNTICGNIPDQIYPDSYPNNYISEYCIGDAGPAGGWIFYDDEVDGVDNIVGARYLEAAPSDQSTSAEWGCNNTLITGADGIAVGTGEQNTIDIETGCATVGTAADICANLILGGESDWFLPSKYELDLMYTNLHNEGVGGFITFWYWSSSEYNKFYAWTQSFNNGNQESWSKVTKILVRAVRAF